MWLGLTNKCWLMSVSPAFVVSYLRVSGTFIEVVFWRKVERVLVESCLYVDDGLLLLPKSVSPLVASATLMFLTSLGVSLS